MEPSEERSEVPSREEGTYQGMVCTPGEVTTEHELLTLESRESMWDVVYSIWAYGTGPRGGGALHHVVVWCIY